MFRFLSNFVVSFILVLLLLLLDRGDVLDAVAQKSKLSVLTSRVHPCESNASYVMRGLISAALNVKSSGRTSRHSPGNQSRAESSPAASLASHSPDQSHAEEPRQQPHPQEPQEPPTEAPLAAANGVPARLLVLVPMLNVDGVINGWYVDFHLFSIYAVELARFELNELTRWWLGREMALIPTENYHPTK